MKYFSTTDRHCKYTHRHVEKKTAGTREAMYVTMRRDRETIVTVGKK
jgi:hypothetical protein